MKNTLVVGIAIFMLSAQALAVRCGNKLVQIGDTRIEVIEKCGYPLAEETVALQEVQTDYFTRSLIEITALDYRMSRRSNVRMFFRAGVLQRIQRRY